MASREGPNDYIYKHLTDLMNERFKQASEAEGRDKRTLTQRALSYQKAIGTLKYYFPNEAIVNVKGDRINGKKLPGIGKGIAEKIAEVLDNTGIEVMEVPTVDIDVSGDVLKTSKKKTSKGPPFEKEKVLLAKLMPEKTDPIGWYMSEKWDGYRAIWDGENFYSRYAAVFEAPEYFKKLMPKNVILDGELWIGRGKFSEAGLFRHKYADPQRWKDADVKYKVFDLPSLDEPFEVRMEELEKIVHKSCRNVSNCPLEYTEQIKVTSQKQLDLYFNEILEEGGEGVMLRKPASRYVWTRSGTLLKIKPEYDSECVVIGYTQGAGKYKGMLGAFRCEWLHKGKKVEFRVSGVSDQIRRDYLQTHPIGSVLTVKYNEVMESGAPRHPRYLRKRGNISGLRYLTIDDFPPAKNEIWKSYASVFKYMKDRFSAPRPPPEAKKDEDALCRYLEKILIPDIK